MLTLGRNRPEVEASRPLSGIVRLCTEFTRWGVDSVASSRSSALIRIGLVFVIWARFADEQLPFRHEFGSRIALCFVFFLATTLMLIGYKAKASTFLTAVLTLSFYFYFGLTLGFEPYTAHHIYLLGIATLFCALTPCDKSYSLDRWFSVQEAWREGRCAPPEEGNVWGLRLIVVQLTMLYFWTAFDKMTPAFINGERLQAIFMYQYPNLSDWMGQLGLSYSWP